ncbi:MAG: heme NO-binding domain-containing protein [Rhodopirellula sp. JB053]
MKGVVNKGLQELVEHTHGEEAWETIRQVANCDVNSFWPAQDYPDELTIALFMATSRHLRVSPDEIMVEFGKFWINNTGKNVYPKMFALVGNNARDFLRRLDFLHQQATISLPGTRGFQLRSEELSDGGLRMFYTSDLPLCRVLHGLILGAGIHFNQTLQIQQVQCTRLGDPECAFDVHFDVHVDDACPAGGALAKTDCGVEIQYQRVLQ